MPKRELKQTEQFDDKRMCSSITVETLGEQAKHIRFEFDITRIGEGPWLTIFIFLNNTEKYRSIVTTCKYLYKIAIKTLDVTERGHLAIKRAINTGNIYRLRNVLKQPAAVITDEIIKLAFNKPEYILDELISDERCDIGNTLDSLMERACVPGHYSILKTLVEKRNIDVNLFVPWIEVIIEENRPNILAYILDRITRDHNLYQNVNDAASRDRDFIVRIFLRAKNTCDYSFLEALHTAIQSKSVYSAIIILQERNFAGLVIPKLLELAIENQLCPVIEEITRQPNFKSDDLKRACVFARSISMHSFLDNLIRHLR